MDFIDIETEEAKRKRKEYKLWWMRKEREKKRLLKLAKEGKCLRCEILIHRNPNHTC